MAGTVKGIVYQDKLSIKWKVERFFADCQKAGDYYLSPIFSITHANKTTNWQLRLYPKGDQEKYKNYVSMFLYFSNESEIEVKVNFQLSIMSENNSLPIREEIAHLFKYPKSNWGWHQFASHDVLKDSKSGALIDDSLTIICEITILPPDQDDTEIQNYDEWLDKIGNGFEDYEKLFENGNFSDVTFNVQDKKIDLHKNILSCRSPVFEAMFSHEMKENKQNSVDITDIDYDVMKELLRFIYSRKVNNIEQIASQLLIAADKYQVIELKALCEKTLYDSIAVENVIEYLKLTEMCDTIHLKNFAIKFVAAHGKNVVKKPEFKDLSSDLMYEIIQAIL